MTLELRAGGPNGTLLGSAPVAPGAPDAWTEARVSLGATGDQDLYVVLRSSASDIGQFNPLARVDALRFEPRGITGWAASSTPVRRRGMAVSEARGVLRLLLVDGAEWWPRRELDVLIDVAKRERAADRR